MIKNSKRLKKGVADAALALLPPNCTIGIGTGSTVEELISALATHPIKKKCTAFVSSSQRTTESLQAIGILPVPINKVNAVDFYIDGADEINPANQLIKGGGAALTGEKILAAMAKKFIVIADEHKMVKQLGHFPLPIEYLPAAESYLFSLFNTMQGCPKRRREVTEYGNFIFDVAGLVIDNPLMLENRLNMVPGIVTVGLFAHRAADECLIASLQGEGIKITYHTKAVFD